MNRHLLVTNDFPPKVGGIQNYLWELWRRLDPDTATVYCTPHQGAAAFDARQSFRVERSPEPFLLPYPWLVERIRKLADEVEADLVLLDPALPLGLIGPALRRPYGVILHGAEVTIPARLPGTRRLLGRVLREASLVVSAGRYALAEAERCARRPLPSVVVPPGVDTERFAPAEPGARQRLRAAHGCGPEDQLVTCVTRLVPRKGMHTLVEASAELAASHPNLRVLIGGAGREEARLRKLIDDLGAPVELIGRVDDAEVVELYQAADLMVMPCNQRWGGLEQEGFGIVFLEAAAAGIPQVAGRSGGAAEAVDHGVTGLVVDQPDDRHSVAAAMAELLSDRDRRDQMSRSARRRAVTEFGYQQLADRLQRAIDRVPTTGTSAS